MAAIDFPASPTVGQVFASTNGVNYQWNGTMWLAVGPTSPTTPGGDFQADGNISITSSHTTLILPTVTVGNSGGYYNASNGRFTPPAGRYSLYTAVRGLNASGATIFFVVIRKNGVSIGEGVLETKGINGWGSASAEVIADANGSDWFDATAASTIGTTTVTANFGAFPLSGIKGPPGEPYPGMVGGDFCAVNTGSNAIPTAATVVVLPTIRSGNSTGSYSTSTGRYTPPAGRFFIACSAATIAAGTGTTLIVGLYKNGVELAAGLDFISATQWAHASCDATLDANGTDYFEMKVGTTGGAGVTSGASGSLTFLAYPISGIKGPQGDPPTAGGGIIREVTLASPAATIDLFSLGVKTVELIFALTPTAASANVNLQFATGSTINTSATYDFQSTYQLSTTPTVFNGQFLVSGTGFPLAQGTLINAPVVGKVTYPDIAITRGFGEANYSQTAGPYLLMREGLIGPTGGGNGFRLSVSTGNFAAGSFVRVIGWP